MKMKDKITITIWKSVSHASFFCSVDILETHPLNFGFLVGRNQFYFLLWSESNIMTGTLKELNKYL